MVIITVQPYSTKSEVRFFVGSNPACGVLEIREGSLTVILARNKSKQLFSVHHTTKTIHYHHHHHRHHHHHSQYNNTLFPSVYQEIMGLLIYQSSTYLLGKTSPRSIYSLGNYK